MSTYKCELIDNGVIKERFYRESGSVIDMATDLKMFQWPAGVWRITNVTDEPIDIGDEQ